MSEEIREAISNLVKIVQSQYVMGSVTSRYECAEHKRFLSLRGVEILLGIGAKNELVRESIVTLWNCDECGKCIVKVTEEE